MATGDAADRAEDLWLSAESLERLLGAQGAGGDVASLAADAVAAARELYNAVAADPGSP